MNHPRHNASLMLRGNLDNPLAKKMPGMPGYDGIAQFNARYDDIRNAIDIINRFDPEPLKREDLMKAVPPQMLAALQAPAFQAADHSPQSISAMLDGMRSSPAKQGMRVVRDVYGPA